MTLVVKINGMNCGCENVFLSGFVVQVILYEANINICQFDLYTALTGPENKGHGDFFNL